MEKVIDVRTKVNFTQLEMAMFLQITRSQWSLYELGLRSLPTAAMIKLSELELFLKTQISQTVKALPELDEQLLKKSKLYNRLLVETLFKKEELIRLIARMEEKHANAVAMLHLLSEVSETSNPVDKLENKELHLLRYKATKIL